MRGVLIALGVGGLLWLASCAPRPLTPPDIEATQRVLSLTGAAVDARATTTQVAQWAASTATLSARETSVVRTQSASETRVVRTQSASETRVAQTQSASETRVAQTQSASETRVAQTQVAQAVRDERDRQRADEWDAYWQGALDAAGDTVRVGLSVVLVAGLCGAALYGGLLAYASARARMVVETRYGTLYVGFDPRTAPTIIASAPARLSAPADDDAPSDAPDVPTIPVYRGGAQVGTLSPADPTKRALALRLLADACQYIDANPGWDTRRIPGHRELGWTSAQRHSDAVASLGTSVVSRGAGRGGGLYVARQYPDVQALYHALDSERIAL